ncbi:MAG: helix-turn-helix domain-containing protein [Myxococcales bacterium]
MTDPEPQDPHEILGVQSGCSGEELRAAYERARRHLGPDSLATYALVEPAEARAMLERIEAAYRALSGPGEAGQKEGTVVEERKETPEMAKDEAPAVPAPAEAKADSPAKGAPTAAVAPAAEAVEAVEAVEAKPAEPAAEAAEPPKPVRKSEAELAPDGPVTGEALRRVREARGLSLKDLEAKTKIGHWHLENIEKEKYKDLPALVYLRGFLQSLARELKLDPIRVSRSYLEEMTKAKDAPK